MSWVRRLARGMLVVAVRGRRERGGEWGEAVLAEFGETRGDLEAVRWAAGGVRTVWRERRRRVRALPLYDRIARHALTGALVAAGAGLLVNQFVLSVRMMPSGSMEPTLRVSDRFLVDKAGFRLTGLHRGDIVVLAGPGGSERVKRVIGLPGDHIECRAGHVWRDGVAVDEPYLPGNPAEDRTECAPTTVPPGHLFVLGDHRVVSTDSRQDGPAREDDVLARVLTPLRLAGAG
ncbi:signal peptidase I [Symbioplanes lichenis]|uniref:signal peptidase I n=1 Tax=Symbioplanes lichenis TaxID=1629072 RepID=UPI0027382F82|nr:signal peptidase I [Actinoplanes lichenis]